MPFRTPAMTTARGMGPLPAMLEEGVGTAAVARAVKGAGLPAAITSTPDMRMPLSDMVALFDEAARVAGDECFGLRVGLAMRPGAYGGWMEYSLAAPTLREAVRRLDLTIPLHQSGCSVALVPCGGTMLLSYRMQRLQWASKRAHSDHIVPTMIQIVRSYLGEGWLPDWIAVDYEANERGWSRTDLVPVPWRFGADAIAMPVPQAAVDLPRRVSPVRTRRPVPAWDTMKALVSDRPETLVSAVKSCIALELLDGRSGIAGVARRLDSSVRALQRELETAGTRYSRLLGSVRLERARELLADPDVPVTEVAFALGYSDPSNFTRAYRRWTGAPPRPSYG